MPDSAPIEIPAAWNVSRESLKRIADYVDLLRMWQKHINLIGASTVEDIWQRHITDALQLIPLLPAAPGGMADLGTGSGLPGLVLSLATGRPVHLYESNGKKVAFLREAIRRTGARAQIHQVRLETLTLSTAPRVVAVTSRALAPLPKLLQFAEPFLQNGAVGLFHKGQDVEVELEAATSYWNVLCEKHRSSVDSRGVILVVKELSRVQSGDRTGR